MGEFMAEPSCPGCRERDAVIAALLERVATLEARVRELEGRLGQNATNSSVPPSANPPDAPKPVVKKRTGRTSGGQPGHQGRSRLRLPPDRICHTIALVPTHCERCQAPLPAPPRPDDPEPSWHQLAELPRLSAVVTEFQGHARTCACCGHVTRERIPAEIRAHTFGPRLAATLAYLSGCQHLSQRGLEEVTETLFGVPVSLGSINALQEQMSQALAQPHQEIAQVVQQAEVKHVDETGWKQAGQRRWLWTAVSASAVYFLIQVGRGAKALGSLLGEAIRGVLCSDRWSAYQAVPLAKRQICWAHLKRDFQAMVDRGGEAAAIGEGLLFHTNILFRLWYKVRDGTRRRRWLQRHVKWLRPEVQTLLQNGAGCACAETAGTCAKILEVEPALWTFARVEGLDPTNNAAERALRPAVLRRKRSFGNSSEAGCQYVSRLLSVVQTVKRQGRSVLEYLQAALEAQRHSLPIPKLFPTT
jgi:transposase